MKFNEIVHIHGKPGLYKVVSSPKANPIIVEALEDQKRFPVTADKVNYLFGIGIYTDAEEMPLTKVFQKMKENEATVDSNDSDKLRKYFKTLIPEMDEERVHTSHMKKMVSWFETLKDKVDFKEEETDEARNAITGEEQEKPIIRAHEGHAPKAEQQKKATTAKLRKKV